MPISLENAQTALTPILADDIEWNLDALVFGSKPAATDSVLQRFNVHPDAHDDVMDGALALLGRLRLLHSDGLLELRPYVAGTTPDRQQIFYATIDDLGLGEVIEDLAEPGDIPLAADAEQIPWGTFALEARILSNGTHRGVFLRKATKATFLGNKKKLFYRNGNLNLATGPMVALESGADAFIVGTVVFMTKPGSLETLLEMREQLEGQATTILGTIVQHVPIAGIEQLAEAAGRHWQMLRKLHHISRQPYLQEITLDDIENVVTTRALPIVIHGEGDARQLSYDASDKWAILRLLDDDYLVSELTKRAYEVRDQAKSVLGGT